MVVAAWCSAVPRSTTPLTRVQLILANAGAGAWAVVLGLRAIRGRLVVYLSSDVVVDAREVEEPSSCIEIMGAR